MADTPEARTVFELTTAERDAAVAAFVAAHKEEPDWGSPPDRAWMEGYVARAALREQPEATLTAALAQMEARKDAAYEERNRVVAALAKVFPSGVKRTAIEGWSEDWHGCVYIDLPTGQASWHFHDSQAHLFDGLPAYTGEWDGHSTEEKYRRIAALREQPQQGQVVTEYNVGRYCLSEDDCIAAGISFAAYERGVLDAAQAFGRSRPATPTAPPLEGWKEQALQLWDSLHFYHTEWCNTTPERLRAAFVELLDRAAPATPTAPPAATGWMPIETAPKDGSLFLCWVSAVYYGESDDGQQYQQDVSQADFCQWRTVSESPDGGYFDPCCGRIGDEQDVTHWMPLPPPPITGGVEQPLYVASRASLPERPAMWRKLRAEGWPIISTWIDEAGPGETADMGELWQRIEREVHASAGVILWAEEEDFPLKGAYIEVGMAIGTGKRVGVVTSMKFTDRNHRPIGSWVNHPLVRMCASFDAARAWVVGGAEPGEQA